MKVILLEKIPNLGDIGAVVEVAPGYGRNYLIPRKKALEANRANLARFEEQRQRLLQRQAKEKERAAALAERLAELTVTIAQRVGEAERLYGSVTNVHIADALERLGVAIDRKKIDLPEPIKTLGTFEVAVKLHPEVTASLKVAVVPETA